MIPPPLSGIFLAAVNWFVSRELPSKIRVGLEELAKYKGMMRDYSLD